MREAFREFLAGFCQGIEDTVRLALRVATFLFGVCYLIAALFVWLLAVMFARHGEVVPAFFILSFLLAWWGLALAISGLERLARLLARRPITSVRSMSSFGSEAMQHYTKQAARF